MTRESIIIHKTKKGYQWKDDCPYNNCIFAVKKGEGVSTEQLYNFCKRYGLIYYYPILNIDTSRGTHNDLYAVRGLASKLNLEVIVN